MVPGGFSRIDVDRSVNELHPKFLGSPEIYEGLFLKKICFFKKSQLLAVRPQEVVLNRKIAKNGKK